MKRILSVYDRSIYEIHEHYIKTIIRFEPKVNVTKNVTKKLSDRQRLILDLMSQDNTVTSYMMAEIFKVSDRTIKRDLGFMQEAGIIRRVGPTSGGKWEVIIQ